jgi:predicted dehydrogenase
MYFDAIGGDHAPQATLVALVDVNPGRIKVHADRMASEYGYDLSTLVTGGPDELEDILERSGAERAIITTPDYTHAEMIVRCLDAGVDVVCEKPLTINADMAHDIEAAVKRTGRSVVVTFNYRYSPRNSELKRVISSGEIGDVLSITFEWVLDTAHGADYFRRWHREKDKSGGLLIHKSSHHFDLVNWWLADAPARVFASGATRFYGAENADKRGLAPRPKRGTHDGEHTPFELDLRTDPRLKELYLDQEKYDGYLRDKDVFDTGISAEDNLAVIVDYRSGATLSYALNAHSPWEGYRVAVNGTLGRAELEVVERVAVLVDNGSPIVDPSFVADHSEGGSRVRSDRLIVQKHWEVAHEVPIPEGEGGHGGGDELLLSDVFVGPSDDPLGRPSDWVDGMRAISVGICANISMAEGRAVTPAELALPLDR